MAIADGRASAVTCISGTRSAVATVEFTATPFGACTSRLGTFGPQGLTVRGTIGAEGNCTSKRRAGSSGRTHWARRHVLVLAHPGWVTVTLQSDPSNAHRLDTYLLILKGDSADGSGAYVAHNDDQASGVRDSRVTCHYLPAGTYSIEATTFGWHERDGDKAVGKYILYVSADHTPVPGASRRRCA